MITGSQLLKIDKNHDQLELLNCVVQLTQIIHRDLLKSAQNDFHSHAFTSEPFETSHRSTETCSMKVDGCLIEVLKLPPMQLLDMITTTSNLQKIICTFYAQNYKISRVEFSDTKIRAINGVILVRAILGEFLLVACNVESLAKLLRESSSIEAIAREVKLEVVHEKPKNNSSHIKDLTKKIDNLLQGSYNFNSDTYWHAQQKFEQGQHHQKNKLTSREIKNRELVNNFRTYSESLGVLVKLVIVLQTNYSFTKREFSNSCALQLQTKNRRPPPRLKLSPQKNDDNN